MPNRPLFSEIERFPCAHYEVDVLWGCLEGYLASLDDPPGTLDLDPDFQRGHVWTTAQQTAYIEYQLRGGEVARNITMNCANWNTVGDSRPIQLLDGKQRIEAVRAFVRNKIVAFGHRCSDYADPRRALGICGPSLKFRMCTLSTREEVLKLYLNINAGGTPHTKEELERVRNLLELEKEKRHGKHSRKSRTRSP